ncbi:MAG: alkaline phosphatase [Calditrichaeota bacterium]|nr:MAG: alkaline phosphatase [Calditrichota bacterium]
MIKIILLSFSTLLMSCSVKFSSEKNSTKTQKPQNIILMIGDGMGLSQVSATYYQQKSNLNLKKIKNIGLMTTHSSDKLVTDSAAGATSFACGIKTYNGAIGVDDNKKSVKTILEYFEDKNCVTGLVATSTITHATPASFVAHQNKRSMHEEIASDIANSETDLIIGGGLKYFTERKDKVNLLEKMNSRGFQNFTSLEDLQNSNSLKSIALLAKDATPRISEGRGDFLPLATEIALDKLSTNKNGFFLMVEGSQIDWGGHDNDQNYLISELVDFDKAIGIAIDFVDKNPETLLIVTADHETGGIAITGGNVEEGKVETIFASKHHTGALIPVYAYGRGSENFRGFYDNTDVFKKMYKLKFE